MCEKKLRLIDDRFLCVKCVMRRFNDGKRKRNRRSRSITARPALFVLFISSHTYSVSSTLSHSFRPALASSRVKFVSFSSASGNLLRTVLVPYTMFFYSSSLSV